MDKADSWRTKASPKRATRTPSPTTTTTERRLRRRTPKKAKRPPRALDFGLEEESEEDSVQSEEDAHESASEEELMEDLEDLLPPIAASGPVTNSSQAQSHKRKLAPRMVPKPSSKRPRMPAARLPRFRSSFGSHSTPIPFPGNHYLRLHLQATHDHHRAIRQQRYHLEQLARERSLNAALQERLSECELRASEREVLDLYRPMPTTACDYDLAWGQPPPFPYQPFSDRHS